ITRRKISITVDSQKSTYGDDIKEMTYRVTTGVLVNGDTIASIGHVEPILPSGVNFPPSGTYFATFVPVQGNGNYDVTVSNTNTRTYEIEKRQITIKFNNVSSVYGNALAEFTYVFLNGTSAVEGDKLFDLSTNAKPNSNVGTYSATVSNKNSNYIITISNSHLNIYDITKRPISISIDSKSSMYGETLAGLTYSVNSSIGIIGSDKIGTLETTAKFNSNVSTYKITFTQTNNNYSIDVVNNGQNLYSITKRQMSISIDGKESMYGDAITGLSYSVNGQVDVIGSDKIGDLKTTATATSNVGEYKITFTPTHNNYSINVTNNEHNLYKITKRKITLSIDEKSSIYGNSLEVLTYTVTSQVDVIGSDKIGVLTTTAKPGYSVGEYSISFGPNNNNYDVSVPNNGNELYKILIREVTIKIDGKDSTYGDTLVPLTYTVTSSNKVIGSDVIGILETTASNTSNIGLYIITFTETNNNYKITVQNNNDELYQIKKRDISIRVNLDSSQYGDSLKDLDYKIVEGSLGNPNDIIVSLEHIAKSTSNIGTYGFKVIDENSNYNVNVQNKDYTVYQITKREINMTISEHSSIYGNQIIVSNYTITSDRKVIKGDYIGKLSTDATNISDVGFYNISFNASNINYKIDISNQNAAIYQITKRPISIVVENEESIYGDEIKEMTYEIFNGELVNDNHVLAKIISKATSSTEVGDYGFTVSEIHHNYEVDVHNINDKIYKITKREVTISIDAVSSQYGDELAELTYTLTSDTPVLPNHIIGTLTTKATPKSNVNLYSITFTLNNKNYEVTPSNNDALLYSIEKRDIYVSVSSNSSEYGDPVNELDYEIFSGTLVEEHHVLLTAKTLATSKSSVDTYSFTYIIEDSNYNVKVINENDYIYEITQRNIEITINEASSAFGEDQVKLSFEVMSDKGIVNNDVIGNLYSEVNNTTPAGVYPITFNKTDANYFVNVTNDGDDLYKVLKARVIIEVVEASSEYGNDVENLTYKIISENTDISETLITARTLATSSSEVGSYGFTYQIEDDSYAITVNNENELIYKVVPREVEIEIEAKSSIYGNQLVELKFNFINGTNAIGNDEIGNLTTEATMLSNVGEYAITFNKTNKNYNVTVSNNNALIYEIQKRAISISVDKNSSQYGEETNELTYSIVNGDLVDSKHILITAKTLAQSNSFVGEYGFLVEIENNNYDITVINKNDKIYSILKREIAIEIDAVSSVFGETMAKLTFEVVSDKGIVNNDIIGSLYADITLTTPVGKYAITFTPNNNNYSVNVKNQGALIYSVVLSAIEIVVDEQSSQYGDEIKELTFKVMGDETGQFDNIIKVVSKATNTSPIGQYGFTYTIEDNNFAVKVLNIDALVYQITKRDVTIDIQASSSVYGSDLSDLTYKVREGFTIIGNDILGTLTTDASNISDVNKYAIHFKATNDNYEITVSNNSAELYEITKRKIDVTVEPNSSVYGDQIKELTYKVVEGSLVEDNHILISVHADATTASGVDKYGFKVTIENNNYDITVTNPEDKIYEITKRDITITINKASSIFEAELSDLSFEVVSEKGIVNGDTIGTLYTPATNISPVGTYEITFTQNNTNYIVEVTNNGAELYSVVEGVIYVKVIAASSQYGNEVNKLTYEVLDSKRNIPNLITITPLATSTSEVGTYGFTYTVESSNYTVVVTNKDDKIYEVKEREVSITIDNVSVEYGKELPKFTYTVNGNVNVIEGDVIGEFTTNAMDLSTVGEYTVTFTSSNKNYNVEVSNNGAILFEIAKRKISITVTPNSSQYGDDVNDLTYTISEGELVFENDILITAKTVATNKDSVNTYGFTVFIENDNYEITVLNKDTQVYSITQREIEIEIQSSSSVFGEVKAELSFNVTSVKDIVNNDIIGTLFTEANESSSVGKYAITFTKTNENYKVKVSNNGELLYSVVLSTIKVKVVANESQYGDKLNALTYIIVGEDHGITETLISIKVNANMFSDVGTYGFTYTVESSNYAVEVTNKDEKVYKITPRAISIEIEEKSSQYGDDLAELTYKVTSDKKVIGLDVIGTLTTDASNLSDVNKYEINFVKTNTNYLVDISNNDKELYEIVKRDISISIDDNSSQYGDDVNDLTYTVVDGKLVDKDHILVTVTTKANNTSIFG
ncbi:MAG: MBG domain-containing protein, partial [Anaeroplasmataceae bacterium]